VYRGSCLFGRSGRGRCGRHVGGKHVGLIDLGAYTLGAVFADMPRRDIAVVVLEWLFCNKCAKEQNEGIFGVIDQKVDLDVYVSEPTHSIAFQ